MDNNTYSRKIQEDDNGPFIKFKGKIFRENLEPNVKYGPPDGYAEHDYKVGDKVDIQMRNTHEINVWECHDMSAGRLSLFGGQNLSSHEEMVAYRWVEEDHDPVSFDDALEQGNLLNRFKMLNFHF